MSITLLCTRATRTYYTYCDDHHAYYTSVCLLYTTRWARASSSCCSGCPRCRCRRARRSSCSGAADSTRGGRVAERGAQRRRYSRVARVACALAPGSVYMHVRVRSMCPVIETCRMVWRCKGCVFIIKDCSGVHQGCIRGAYGRFKVSGRRRERRGGSFHSIQALRLIPDREQ